MVVIIKYYLVDSENVNDNWLMLLDLSDETDKIIVFYTKNSPHMSYSSVIKLLGCTREIKFEECNAGNNALDFQLISYLGYLMKNEELKDSEFIVMSNDTGYDPAVNFWKKRDFPVNRINVNYCKLALQRQKEAALRLAEQSNSVEVQSTEDFSGEESHPGSSAEELPFKDRPEEVSSSICPEPLKEVPASQKPCSFDKEEVDALINCLGKDNLIAIHETLVHVYGQKQGQNIYKTVKDKSYSFAPETLSRKDKVHYFTDIIFSHSDLDDPGNFLDFLEKNKDKSKNLNGVRSAITKAYGNNIGMKYYSLFKPYFKTISALK